MALNNVPVLSICENVSIALLAEMIVEEDPISSNSSQRALIRKNVQRQLWTAFQNGEILGHRVHGGSEIKNEEGQVDIVVDEHPSPEVSCLKVSSAREYLQRKGIKCAFLGETKNPDYLDPENDWYAPKLAAAIGAWQAVTSDKSLRRAKSPKQALEKWLVENATQYQLSNQGVQDAAKVANWDFDGGATKTPE